MVTIRPAGPADADAIWAILEPVVRAGETYALPRNLSRADSLAFWFGKGHEVFVAESGGEVIGTYFLRANQSGGGAHVANCGSSPRPPRRAEASLPPCASTPLITREAAGSAPCSSTLS